MNNKVYTYLVSCLIALLASNLAWAGGRPNDSTREWFGQFSPGWMIPQGDTSDVLDDTITFSGGALFWPRDWPAGINVNLAYADPNISKKAINAINAHVSQDPNNSGTIDDGDVRIWNLSVDGVWSLGKNKTTGFYLTGGAGVVWLDGKISSTGLVYYPPFCDPWFWYCTPGGFGEGSIVEGSHNATKFGWNAGVGYSFTPGDVTQWFIETRYTSIMTDRQDTTYIPIETGLRW